MENSGKSNQLSKNSPAIFGTDELENKALLQQLLHIVPSVVYVRDLQEVKNVFINRSVSDELGYTAEEVIAMGADFPKQVMHPDDYVRIPDLEGKFQTLGDGEVVLFEYRMKHRDGQWRWYLSRDCIFKRSEDGTPLQVIGTATDITARKNAETTLYKSEALYRSLFNSIDEGFCVVEVLFNADNQPVDYRFLEINPKFEEQTGLKNAAGKTARELLPDLEAHWFEIYGKVALTGEPNRFMEGSSVMNRWFDVYAFRVGEPQEHQVAILFRDISLQKNAEAALRESEKRLRLAVKNSNIILAEVNSDLSYKWIINPHKDFDEAFSIGKRDDELLPMEHARSFIEIKEQVFKSGIGRRSEVAVSLSDNLHIYDYQVEPLLDTSGTVIGITTAGLDITERKAAEEKLQESEARFRDMADHAPVMIWVTEPDGSCTYLSQSWYEFTGQTPETGLGIGWLKAVHPDDEESSGNIFLTANKNQVAFRLEYRLRRHDGVYRWAIDSAKPRFSPQGKFLGYIGSVIDITERKYHELNTQFLSEITHDLTLFAKSEDVMRLLSEKIARHLSVSRVFFVEVDEIQNVSIVLYDWCAENLPSTVGTYPLKNYAGEAFLQELKLGKPVVIDDVRMHPITAAHAARFEALKMIANINAPHLNNGQLKFLLAVQHTQPYHWREDEISLLQELSARIWTQIERNNAQEALRESENRLRLAQQAAGIGIHDFNVLDGTIQWDACVRELWGVGPDEVITYDVFSTGVHPDDLAATQAAVNRALDPNGDGQYYAEYRVTNKKDGLTRWIVATGQVSFKNGQALRLVGTVQDITERKELEAMKDAFVRIAGHELRTPLTSLLGNLSLAKRMMQADHPGSSQLQKATEGALKMRNLIQDFLDSYRLQHLEITYEKAVFNFDALIQKVIDNTKAAHPKYDILLQGQTDAELNGDPNRIEQMINNLLNNAIKYSPGNNQVEVFLQRYDTHIQLIIKDYGIGIASEEIPSIFNRFHRATNTGKIKGMGLGLYLVKQIAEYHKGTIQVNSTLGEGSRFIVELPI